MERIDLTRHSYQLPLVRVFEKNGPETRRKLREMARPLREGCIRFGSGLAAWPHGSLQYITRSDGKKHVTVAFPAHLDLFVMVWETTEARTLMEEPVSESLVMEP